MTKKMPNLTIYGDGSQKSIITGNKNNADGVKLFNTATFGMAQQISSQCMLNLMPIEHGV